jgi:hypothetical protein
VWGLGRRAIGFSGAGSWVLGVEGVVSALPALKVGWGFVYFVSFSFPVIWWVVGVFLGVVRWGIWGG